MPTTQQKTGADKSSGYALLFDFLEAPNFLPPLNSLLAPLVPEFVASDLEGPLGSFHFK